MEKNLRQLTATIQQQSSFVHFQLKLPDHADDFTKKAKSLAESIKTMSVITIIDCEFQRFALGMSKSGTKFAIVSWVEFDYSSSYLTTRMITLGIKITRENSQ